MVSTKEFSRPVRRSLLQRELILGIPQTGVLLLLVLCFFLLYTLRMYFMAVPIAILYALMRILTKKDPFLIDIMVEHVNQKDTLIP
jgi:type IV secretory pathway TrbD component